MKLKNYFEKIKKIIDINLKKYLKEEKNTAKLIYNAMNYSLFPGGKRIRPILTIATAKMCNLKYNMVLPTACAIELIHTYSLIHDDLPAMDNDDYRRGKLTIHRKFNECIAILTGDALLTKAFGLLTKNCEIKGIKKENVLKNIKLISDNAGLKGMVAGQALDSLYSCIKKVKNIKYYRKFLKKIHLNKTANLIKTSILSAGILADLNKTSLSKLEKYGKNIGLAFQIMDDIFDKDKTGLTYPKIYGEKMSLKIAQKLVDDAKKSLYIFGKKANILKQIADYIITRKLN